MQEHSPETAVGISTAIVKAVSSAGFIGSFAGAIGFLFLWPKDRKEGFARIFFSGVSSHFFGEWVVRTVANYADWLPVSEIRPGCYMLAGLFGWFIGAAIFKYFGKGKDIQEIAKDVKDAA